ncbi:MAG TPA: tRNA preQ1(34) S-adenosylmethionine ribosyltransferase-isomerase QueA [Acidobacteriaceae bacterium]|nr:tRNA preQ1(34) S-adenosylmethionine ribosyltransferase-isomerase QueA [Acidobacteriaceae bacterium]
MKVSEFHFDLPPDLIAQHPPEERGASRMLVVRKGQETGNREQETGIKEQQWLRDAWFRELPELLCAGDLLVLNDSRVLPARLFGRRVGAKTQGKSPDPSGTVEVLLTEQVDPADPSLWNALVRPAKKVVPGETLLFFAPGPADSDAEPVLRAEVTSLGCYGERTLRFSRAEGFYEVVSRIGHMPLPPYIRREQAFEPDSAEDRERYQTVYAEQVGSAAAPTAGLHFTPEVLAALEAKGVEVRRITLHVGLGTFQPVRVENVEEIRLHPERYTLPPDTAEAVRRALREERRIVAVGTTTTRTLEHVAAQAAAGAEDWVAGIQPHSGSTSIFLSPGYRFRVVSGLLTNFHLPESTLLMLVSAIAAPEGEPDLGRLRVLAAYRHAVAMGYRFYSYGDCMLLV